MRAEARSSVWEDPLLPPKGAQAPCAPPQTSLLYILGHGWFLLRHNSYWLDIPREIIWVGLYPCTWVPARLLPRKHCKKIHASVHIHAWPSDPKDSRTNVGSRVESPAGLEKSSMVSQCSLLGTSDVQFMEAGVRGIGIRMGMLSLLFDTQFPWKEPPQNLRNRLQGL